MSELGFKQTNHVFFCQKNLTGGWDKDAYANNAVALETGIELKKRWVSTNDERTRKHHRAVNGQEVGMDEDFIIPYNGVDYRLKYSGDPRGGPHNTINCRCVVVYFESGDEIIDE